MTGEQIERLLDEVRATSGPVIWQRVEELMRGIVGLYGEGLERLVAIAAEHDGDAGLADRVAADPVVSSLLLLHGLHPWTAAERIRRALDALRPRLGVRVELVEVNDAGVARLRVEGASGCGLDAALREAVEGAAPELTGVDIARAEAAPPLVQIGVGGGRRRS